MARKTASRMDKRREAEAAEAREKSAPKKKAKKSRKKTTKRKSRSKKSKAPPRERLVWAVFGGNMKEEARFPWDQRDEADAKIEQLRSKSKKLYFIQPIKEPIEGPAPQPGGDREEEEE